MAEVPITLGVRKNGYSKMAYTRSFWLGYAHRIVRLYVLSAPQARSATSDVVEQPQRLR